MSHPPVPSPGPAPTPDRRGFATGCLVAALGVVAAGIGGLLWLGHEADDWLNPPGPDVTAIASSAPVDAADQGATAQLDGEVKRVQGLLPWVRPVAQAVQDSCTTSVGSDEFGSRPTWGPVVCDRTVVWFGATHGPLPQALARLDKALEHAGIQPVGTPIDRLYAIDHARSPTLDSAEGGYGDRGVALDITADPPADPQQAPLSDSGLLLSGSTATATPSGGVRAYRPVLLTTLARQVTSPDYLITVSMRLPYYTQPATSPTPSPPGSSDTGGGGGCMTGSNNCPGG